MIEHLCHESHLGSEVCVGQSLTISIQQMSIQQFIVTMLRLRNPRQTFHWRMNVLELNKVC